MAVKKTQMFRKNLDTSETNLYPLTEAQYVSMENGQTVQEILSDRDSDKYTPVITNNSSTFKVGQGDNVDLSSSMKEGAYDSCVLKGKTMINCIQESSSQDVVLPYEFQEGREITITDTKESGTLGIELKGQTLVNLAIDNNLQFTEGNQWLHIQIRQEMLSVTKKYWVQFNSSHDYGGYVHLRNKSTNTYITNATGKNFKQGLNMISVGSFSQSSLESFSDIKITFHLNNGSTTIPTITDIMLIEYVEGMENWDIPYFEGMASVNMPTIKTYDGQYNFKLGKYSTGGALSNNQQWLFFDCKPSTNYEITLKSGQYNRFGVYSFRGTFGQTLTNDTTYKAYMSTTSNTVHQITIKTSSTANLVGVYLSNGDYNTTLDDVVLEVLENGRKLSDKSSILSLPEEVVLRSLPNGVCDTFNTRTGVYTQRIGEVVLDGENYKNFSRDSELENDTTCKYFISNFFSQYLDGKGGQNEKVVLNCNYLPPVSFNHMQDKTLSTYPCIANSGAGSLNLRVGKDINSTSLLLAYLQSNPITIQYELAIPIVTKINLPSTLKSWNTTTYIYSEIPENSLYPTLSHSNPTYPVILKPSTKYSIVANSYSNGHTNSPINFNLGGATASTTIGNRVTTITTPSTLSNELLTMSGRGNKLNNVMVIEGDVAGDEPYFEGICDCKSPILSNVGKNLFDEQRHSNPDNFFVHSAYWSIPIQLKGNTEYRFSYTFNNVFDKQAVMRFATCKWTSTDHSTHPYSLGQVFNRGITSNLIGKTESMSFVTPADGLVYLHYYNSELTNSPSSFNLASWYTHILKDIQLEESSTSTQYESYQSNTTTFEQKDGKTIVLRSLPNGVCDTLNVETGEYVQRIGERTLNGSEDWGVWQQGGDHLAQKTVVGFRLNLDDAPTTKNFYVLCDHFATGGTTSGANNDHTYYVYHKELIYGYHVNASTHHRLGLSVSKTKLGIPNDNTNATQALAGLRTYLASNHVTVQYELATPIVSTIDVQGFPYAYTNGHVQLSSGHSGQSLTPKVEYSLSANKTGQIDSNTRQVVRQQKQLDDFEAMMLTSLVESAYDKAILQFDYEMQMMSLGGE